MIVVAHKARQRTLAQWERVLARRVLALLRGDARAVQRALQVARFPQLAVPFVVDAIEQRHSRWHGGLLAFCRRVAAEQDRRIRTMLAQPETMALRQIFLDWFTDELVDRVRTIVDSTARQARQLLLVGLSLGETVQQLAERLRQEYTREALGVRALRIARTETINAVNGAQVIAARDLGGTGLMKCWLSARDPVVRDAHRSADGQCVPVNGVFVVNGEQLRWPGDSGLGASAGNVANCRCTLTYQRGRQQLVP